jgi:hypothetical protein
MTKTLHILLFLTAVFDSLIMSASLPLKGKTFCVTGASSGIGAAIAKVCNILVTAIARSYIHESLTSLLLVSVCGCVRVPDLIFARCKSSNRCATHCKVGGGQKRGY